MTYLEQYYQAIQKGKVIVGQELKMLLDNLMDDLKNDKYEYDTSEAYLRIEFIEAFCKHTQDPFTGQPFLLMLWEKAFIEVVYSFKIRKTGRDRFKKILLLIARKNGKSTLCAALAFCELMLGDGKSLICASNNDEQARIIFDEVANMARLFDPNLKKGMMRGKYVHINITNIKNKVGNSLLKRLTDRQKSGLGRNLNFAIVDESNQLKTADMPSQLIKGTSIKPNAKFINITTEGVEVDGYLDNELKKCRQILKGERDDASAESTLAWLYTMDSEQEIWTINEDNIGDIEHPCVLQKANPSLYEVKQPQYILEQLAESRIDKAERMQTLIFDFNIKQNNSEAWLLEQDVESEEVFDLEEFRGSYFLSGCDFSETTDLTAISILLMKPNDDKKYIHTKYFIPESKLLDKQDEASGSDYPSWTRQGLIEISKGNENDLSKVAEWFLELYNTYNLKPFKSGYDQRFSKDYTAAMDKYQFEYEMVIQNNATMSNPMKLLEADLKSRLVNYNKNPVLKWNLLNCGVEMNNLGQIRAVKVNSQSTRRIDGAVSTIIVYEMFRRYKTEFLQRVNRR